MKTDTAQGAQVAPMNRGEVRPTVEKELTTGDVGRTEDLSETSDARISVGPLPLWFWLQQAVMGGFIPAPAESEEDASPTTGQSGSGHP